MKAMARAMMTLATASVLAGACGTNAPTYFPGSSTLEVDGSGTEVIQTLQLPFRPPTTSEEQARQKLSGELGYEVPWLREDRVHVEIRFTITGLPDADRDNDKDPTNDKGSFSLNVDGASEFVRYDAAAVAAAFEAADLDVPAIHGLYQVLPPVDGRRLGAGDVYQNTVREDDLREMALDLDAMGRWMAPNFPAVLLYRSEKDPNDLHAEYQLLPPDPANSGAPTSTTKVIRPALWELTLRFNANHAMRCEFLVRVRDDEGRLWEDGQNLFMPAPTTYAPALETAP
jgi:predicted small lipoprotein YifL